MIGSERHPAEKACDEVIDELADCEHFHLAREAAVRMRDRWMAIEEGPNGLPEWSPATKWGKKADENVDEWGLQDAETLLLAMQEELGELTQAYLESEHEDGDPRDVRIELDGLGALCFQLSWALDNRSVDTDSDRS